MIESKSVEKIVCSLLYNATTGYNPTSLNCVELLKKSSSESFLENADQFADTFARISIVFLVGLIALLLALLLVTCISMTCWYLYACPDKRLREFLVDALYEYIKRDNGLAKADEFRKVIDEVIANLNSTDHPAQTRWSTGDTFPIHDC